MTDAFTFRFAATSLTLSLASAAAQATVIDSFANTATGATVSVTTGGGNWISESYAGAGVYGNGTRLVAGRAGHSNGSNLTLNPSAGTLSNAASSGSALGFDLNYGTGVGNWYNTIWAPQQYGVKPVLASGGTADGQLNISAALTDSLYIESSSAGSVWTGIYIFGASGTLLGSYAGNINAGHNEILLSSFTGLTASEAADIDGIRYTFYDKMTVSEVGFSVSSPVPEPETYASMLAGLALLGIVGQSARRR